MFSYPKTHSYVIFLMEPLPSSLDEVIDGSDVVMDDFQGGFEERLVEFVLQQLINFLFSILRLLER